MITDNSELENKESSFEILQKKDWILDWQCVRFKNGFIVVMPPNDGSVKFTPISVQCKDSLESFNYLKEYLNKRLDPVLCSIEGMTLTLYDTIRLNEAIQKFAKVSKQQRIKVIDGTLVKKKSPRKMLFHQALSMAQQMTLREFEKYKSEYINYLIKLQCDKYKIIPCVEKLAHMAGETAEYAFLFSIKCCNGHIMIVHENVNPDRSTLLFWIKEKEYEKTVRAIYDFLQSAEINKRSSIRERTVLIPNKGVITYKSVNHDDLDSWKILIGESVNKVTKEKKIEIDVSKTNFHSLSRLLRELQTRENFKKVEPVFKKLNLPLTRRVKPADIMAIVPNTSFYIDADGQKRLPIREGAWSLDKLVKLILPS